MIVTIVMSQIEAPYSNPAKWNPCGKLKVGAP